MRMKRILIAPMDWGLGHASRCIPVVEHLLARGASVVLGGCGDSLALLRHRFPACASVELPSYAVRYSRRLHQGLAVLGQLPRLLRSIRAEERLAPGLVHRLGIDGIIADNRYGLCAAPVPSAIICHQLQIPLPGSPAPAEQALYALHRQWLARYGQVWIPDWSDSPGLAGRMSHPQPLPPGARYLGPLSHLPRQAPPPSDPHLRRLAPPQILAVLSGPEPHRSLLEARLLDHLRDLPSWLVQGLPQVAAGRQEGAVSVIPFLGSSDLAWALRQAGQVICRPGYSSVMDLAALGQRRVLFVPTPGQGEQYALARALAAARVAPWQTQGQIDLGTVSFAGYRGFEPPAADDRLAAVLDAWLGEP
ncbi:MAG: glycosyltransferase [Bacteroidia bacterium]